MRGRLIVSSLVGLAALAGLGPASAAGDGFPGPTNALNGVTNGGVRYETLFSGDRTVIARIDTDGGEVRRYRPLRDQYVVAGVAADGSGTGLSGDGETLVLVGQPRRYPPQETSLLVLDAHRFDTLSRIALDGNFSLDAVSPDGGMLYLIEYLARRDLTQYAVRAYDLGADRLLPTAITDPTEPAEEMRGFPVARAMSPDGRWAYTLYDGSGGHPFIHALDTVNATARCIDLHGLAALRQRQLYDLMLEVGEGGEVLTVMDRSDALPRALVDTATFEVSEPPAPADSAGGADDSDGGFPWLLLVALAGLGALVVAATLRHRRLASA